MRAGSSTGSSGVDFSRMELLWTAEGGTDADVVGDLHCWQERTGFTTCVVLGVLVETE